MVPRCGLARKPALSSRRGHVPLALRGLRGISNTTRSEFTFTALAGTPLRGSCRPRCAQHGQYLPFDPPLVARGATLGGTVAAGLSGPGRFRYGGVRDFLLGVQFVDGSGRLVAAAARW